MTGDPVTESGLPEPATDGPATGVARCRLIVDADGRPHDCLFVETNAVFDEITGLPGATGALLSDLRPDEVHPWFSDAPTIELDEHHLSIELLSRSTQRSFTMTIIPMGAPTEITVVVQDTTDSDQQLVDLVRSEREFRALADHLPLMVWVHDADGNQQFVNQTFCDYFGVDREEMKEHRWQVFTHPHDDDTYVEDFEDAVVNRRRFHREVRARRADGQWRWLESWGTPRFDEDGAYLGHIGASADVTARKSAEEAVERTLAAEHHARVRAETLESVAGALAAAVGVDEAARAIVETVGRDQNETLSVVIERDRRLFVTAMAGADIQAGYRSVPVEDQGPLPEVFRGHRTLVVNDRTSFLELFPEHRHIPEVLGFEAAMAIPLSAIDGETLGVLVATSTEPGHYDEDRQNLLTAVAAQAGAALERARLHEQAEHQRRHEGRARTRAEVIAHTLTEIERARHVGHQVVRLADVLVPRVADFVTIEDPALDDPVLALAHRNQAQGATLAALRRRYRLDPDDPSSVSRVVGTSTHRMGELTPEARSAFARNDDAKALLESLGVHSYLAIPIDLGPSRPGVLLCGLSEPDRRPYDDDDERFLTEVAQRAGAILTATALREQEHESLLRLQKALLPDRLKDHPAIDVAARYEAAASVLAVGGDWYDTFVWHDRHYGVVVGDVVGHGIAAAASMGRLRAASATLIAAGDPHPLAMLEAIEQCARGPDGIDFLTAFVAVVDTETGRLSYASAGHPPALVISGREAPRLLDDALSAPICSLRIEERAHACIDLGPDDIVIAFTDGLVERRKRSIHDGLDELRAVASSLGSHDVEDLNRVLVDRMVTDGGDDDVVALSLRYAPSGDRFRSRFPADRRQLAPLRSRLSAWLERQGAVSELHDRVMLGTAEACANAVEHAYRGLERSDVGVRAGWDGDALVVIVTDAGVWQEAQTSSVNRGRGLTIIGRVADTTNRVTGPTGTTLTMRFTPAADVTP